MQQNELNLLPGRGTKVVSWGDHGDASM